MNTKDVGIAILAKAPLPGFAKTRLMPAFGAAAAARIHRELTLQTLRTACAAGMAKVSLWCAPDPERRFFRAISKAPEFAQKISLYRQIEGDLGQRMAAVFVASTAPILLIGTDCPPMNAMHLRDAAQALNDGFDAVFIPAEDGGYALVGLRRPVPAIFDDIDWGSDRVLAQTYARLSRLGLRSCELETLWDVDRAEDVARWRKFLQADAPSRFNIAVT